MKYKNYLLTVLLVIHAYNYVDRQVLGLVLQDIKADLDLSDTQLGFLSGIAFALFYSLMGLPIARWADRGNRVRIIVIATAVWSGMVALCGLCKGFLQLLVVRVGVAVGEAGCFPPGNSLIADYFSRAERPRAAAIYMMGPALSSLVGFFVGGWLNELFGWRVTFMLLGLPGLALAGLAWFTLHEPRCDQRLGSNGSAVGQSSSVIDVDATSLSAQAGLAEVCLILWTNITFRHLLLGYSIGLFFTYGIWLWQPSFFIRSHGVQTGQLGTWFAVIWGIGGLVGSYWGGELACRYAANNERLQLKAMGMVYCTFGVLAACMYLSPDFYVALGLMGLAAIGIGTTYGPLLATIQSLVPANMRATSVATIYLFSNLIGMGLGPLATGALSDAFRAWVGEESLRYSLLVLCPGYIWAGWHLWRASRTVTRDLECVATRHSGLVHDQATLSSSIGHYAFDRHQKEL